MAGDKDTIYIDIDDEITGVIDKVTGAKGKVVALVLPKRAAVFQSIVNMKLLKRAAASSNKNLVLITSESGLLPLAGAAGIHVAKTLTSKPEIPAGPKAFEDEEETVNEEDLSTDDEPEVDEDKSVGELAGAAAAGAVAAKAADGVETVTLDDDDLPEDTPDAPKTKDFTPKNKGKKNSKLKVPDFDRFRLLLIGGGILLLLLLIGFIFANTRLNKATILIDTDATKVDSSVNLNLSTTATELNSKSNTVPAKLASVPKTYTQTVPTTGQKNNGNKASGSVTLTNCTDSDYTLPAGSGMSSSSGNTYISQNSVTIPASNFKSNGQCKNDGKASVGVIAQSSGTASNMPSGSTMSVAGASFLSGQSGTISGGTDNIVQSVNQNDINNAKAKITANDNELKSDLKKQLKDAGYYPLDATYTAGTPTVSTSARVGDAANTVTVTENVTYTMFGVKKDDLNTLLNNDIKTQIDTEKQSILDNGLGSANFNVTSLSATGGQLTMSASATAGPDLNIDSIKSQAAGKRAGAIKEQFSGNPDVKSVEVKFSPFWVSTAPKNTSHIKVVIAKPTSTAKSNNSDASN